MKLRNRKELSVSLEGVIVKLYINTNESVNPTAMLDAKPLHSHFYAELFVCGQGEIALKTENNNITLSGGDGAVIPSGVQHCRDVTCGDNAKWLSIGVLVFNEPNRHSNKLYHTLSTLITGKGTTVFRNRPSSYSATKELITATKSDNSLIARLNFITELISLADCVDTESNNTNISPKEKNIDILLNFENILHHRYTQPLSAALIAAELCIGERQLYRIVKECFGAPIHTLIIKRRIEVASQLLTDSDNSVESIGFKVGFQNKMTFFRTFRKLMGMTPLAYRKIHRS